MRISIDREYQTSVLEAMILLGTDSPKRALQHIIDHWNLSRSAADSATPSAAPVTAGQQLPGDEFADILDYS